MELCRIYDWSLPSAGFMVVVVADVVAGAAVASPLRTLALVACFVCLFLAYPLSEGDGLDLGLFHHQ